MIDTEIDGRYRVQEALGEGGAGTVYRAVHVALGREVALKVLHREYGASPELRARFEREARALSALSHPNVVGVLDSGVSGDQPYLVMELLRGQSLLERLKNGPLPLDEAIFVMRQLLTALAFVHESGLVHRDVKPANVFLSDSPEGAAVRLLDFGLAKFAAPESDEKALTRAGQVFGTPLYMAPEQVAGQEADARVDVYAAGIVFFEMLTGVPPFRGDASDILRQQVVEDVPLKELPDGIPSSVVDIIGKATAKTRKDRYSDGREMLGALEAALDRQSGPAEVEPAEAEGPSMLRRVAVRLTYLGVTLVSLGAIAAIAYAAYVWVTPSRSKERLALESILGPPASAEPGDAEPVASVAETLPEPVAAGAPSSGSLLAASAAPVPSAAPLDQPAAASSAPRPPLHDPWVGAPPELLRLSSKVNHGRFFDKRDTKTIHQYNAKHASDPRGHLLLARSHLRRRWIKDATSEYASAYEVDHNAAGDPRMLPDLLTLIGLGSTEAPKLVMEAYGKDAEAALARELAKKTLKPDHRARLERFRYEITGKPGSG